MGLKNLLQTQGSPYSAANGASIPVNPLATKNSALHYDGTTGYSIDGAATGVTSDYQLYNDGVNNPIPLPTQLDLEDPLSTALYTGATGQRYLDNPPT